MLKALKLYLDEARRVGSDVEFAAHADAIVRAALQYSTFSLAEWVIEKHRGSGNGDLSQEIDFSALRKPADGTLVQILSRLVIECERLGWRGPATTLWAPLEKDRLCEALLESESPNLEGVLLAHVRRRNDGAGHGLPGGFNRSAEEDLLVVVLDRLEPLIPTATPESPTLVLRSHGSGVLPLKLLRSFDGSVQVIRQVRSAKAGRCVVKAQIQRRLGAREEISYETDDVLDASPQFRVQFIDYMPTGIQGWEPLACIPDALTEHFSGREEEIEQLRDWYDYLDSKSCLVFGDGGMGKTTLVVEFLRRVVEGRVSVDWRPDLLFFYTAKRTRWGLNGLEVISPSMAGASDIALSIARALEGTVGREWYVCDSIAAVNRLSTLLAQHGLTRNKVLIVVDNAETLAHNDGDVAALSRAIRELNRRVGRLIVTSRRREHIEAQMLELSPLSDDDAETLLRRRGTALQVRHIQQAGSSTLKGYARRLGCKPLVLDVFVQSLCEPDASLERAFSRVQQMQNQDLGEFLYSDAWQRLGDPLRKLLLLMSRVGEAHDEILLKLCAHECGVSVLEAQKSIDESRGIASVSRIDGSLHVTFTPEFMRFCANRTVSDLGRDFPDSDVIEKVGRRYRHFQSSASRHIQDKTGRAFRHPLARAAYRAATAPGGGDDAEAWYELAVGADSSNAALHDRYAYFLMSRNKLNRAHAQAQSATNLEPDVSEFWFTRGIIESKLGKSTSALRSLSTAQKLGKPFHLCALQMAYAYTKSTPIDWQAVQSALMASSDVPHDDPYRHKHLGEVERLKRRVARERAERVAGKISASR